MHVYFKKVLYLTCNFFYPAVYVLNTSLCLLFKIFPHYMLVHFMKAFIQQVQFRVLTILIK